MKELGWGKWAKTTSAYAMFGGEAEVEIATMRRLEALGELGFGGFGRGLCASEGER